ncbi:alpha/beta fold hydrolase [Calidifontimicrobium sp. SYSU G02091]|uniref:alpha/beta fold hydrolase n=1 Tax=Calidifontimicrobium sp. SYSU G02091 TaxID=2926421 RepID=UPI0030146A30
MTPALVTAAPLAHWRWGAGDTAVVMLHGVGGGRDAWSDATGGTGGVLADAGYLAVAPDLPGYGDSPTVTPYTMAALAEAVVALVESVGATRTVLVGHSMGGMVAQEVLATRPGLVHALVLSGTSPAFGKPDGDWQRRFLAERLAPLDAGQGMAALAPGLARGMAAPDADPQRIARCAAVMARVPEATYRAALHAIVGFDRRADLPRIAVPTLCLAGECDRNASPAVMQRMAQAIPGAEYRCLPGVGHLANMEAPAPFHAALLDFLRRHVPVAAVHP